MGVPAAATIVAVLNVAIGLAVQIGVSMVSRAIQSNSTSKAGGDSDRKQMVMIREPAAVRPLVYGRMRIGGVA
ncbi:MAG: hypothetical protein ACREM3_23635 [Candidatus Rokuibacteriota bacterium]